MTVSTPVRLDAATAQSVRELAAEVARLDAAEPLDEAALLHLGSAHVQHACVYSSAGTVLGYLQQDGESVQVLVAPGDTRVEVATELLTLAERQSASGNVFVWARGQTSPVAAAATDAGYTEDRVLLVLSRSLGALPEPRAVPAGVRLRAFRPQRDDEAWLAVNAAAFAHHPEQGAWTQADLDDRLAQPWFDAAGFLLAVDVADRLLGYHWTKLHPPQRPAADPIGEVYVLGVAPTAQGRGLGRVLLDAGLTYLARGPAREVILYVEQDNASAVRLYENAGFTTTRRMAQFRRF